VAISYLYLRKDQLSQGDKAPLMYAFVEYVLSDEGQALLADYNFEAVPQDVIDVSLSALAMLDMPADQKNWTFESDTNKGGGQEDYVISKKRRSHYEYALGELESEMATQADLEAAVAALQAQMFVRLDGSGTTNPSKYYWEIMSLFEARAKPPVKMTYRAVGSSARRRGARADAVPRRGPGRHGPVRVHGRVPGLRGLEPVRLRRHALLHGGPPGSE